MTELYNFAGTYEELKTLLDGNELVMFCGVVTEVPKEIRNFDDIRKDLSLVKGEFYQCNFHLQLEPI